MLNEDQAAKLALIEELTSSGADISHHRASLEVIKRSTGLSREQHASLRRIDVHMRGGEPQPNPYAAPPLTEAQGYDQVTKYLRRSGVDVSSRLEKSRIEELLTELASRLNAREN